MTPAGAAHNSADLIKGIEKKWEDTKLFMNTLAKISMVKGRKAVTAHEICPTLKAAALVADGGRRGRDGGGTSRLLYDSRFSAMLRYFIQLKQGNVPP